MTQPTFLEAAAAIAAAWPWFWPVVGAILGGVFGSFLNCAMYRVPRGLSLRHPPSQCDACGTRLGIPDLVPVLSYLALRGRCRHCGTSIGMSSLYVELTCAIAMAILTLYAQSLLF